jgi:hypothetical protein
MLLLLFQVYYLLGEVIRLTKKKNTSSFLLGFEQPKSSLVSEGEGEAHDVWKALVKRTYQAFLGTGLDENPLTCRTESQKGGQESLGPLTLGEGLFLFFL